MEKKFDVLSIGLIVQDILVKPVPGQLLEVDAVNVDDCKYMPGGDALNQSVILSRLGAKVGLVGKIGADLSGKMLLTYVKESGVDVSNVKIDSYGSTGTSIVLINENGDRNFIIHTGSNSTFSIDDIDDSIIGQTRLISIGSFFGLQMLDGAGAQKLFKKARENNVITVADAVRDRRNIGLKGIKGVLEYTDIFAPSFIEAKALTNETEPEKMADVLLEYGVKSVVIKLGDKGCFIKSNGISGIIPSYKTKVVDTTGAGDNFIAGFITGILKGWNIWESGAFGNAVGALSVRSVGATGHVENMEQVLEYINNSK